jgi:hypothetical protein
MASPSHRTTERVCVGLYALVGVGSVLAYLAATNAPPPSGDPRPAGGAAFAAVGLFWVCILVAAAMGCVLLVVNAARVRRGEGADLVVVALALAVPGGLLAALAVALAVPGSGVPLLLAAVGLVVAPAGLLVATFRGAAPAVGPA